MYGDRLPDLNALHRSIANESPDTPDGEIGRHDDSAVIRNLDGHEAESCCLRSLPGHLWGQPDERHGDLG